eukprot:380233-Pelagomonas_calceolata.AAC.1
MFMHNLLNPLLGSHVRPRSMLLRHLQIHVLVHKHTEVSGKFKPSGNPREINGFGLRLRRRPNPAGYDQKVIKSVSGE